MKTLNQAIKEANKEYTTKDGSETFHVEESMEYWEIYSSVFGDSPATTYDKRDWTYEEAVSNYRENGIY
jgi:hypothetical protein